MAFKQVSQSFREYMIGLLWSVGAEFDNVVAQVNAVFRSLNSWTAITYAAGNFFANGAMTWTVSNGNVTTFEYSASAGQGYTGGGTMSLHLHVVNSTVGGTLNNQLKVTLPASRVVLSTCSGAYSYKDNTTWGTGVWEATAGTTTVQFYKVDKSNWSASTGATDIRATLVLSVQ